MSILMLLAASREGSAMKIDHVYRAGIAMKNDHVDLSPDWNEKRSFRSEQVVNY